MVTNIQENLLEVVGTDGMPGRGRHRGQGDGLPELPSHPGAQERHDCRAAVEVTRPTASTPINKFIDFVPRPIEHGAVPDGQPASTWTPRSGSSPSRRPRMSRRGTVAGPRPSDSVIPPEATTAWRRQMPRGTLEDSPDDQERAVAVRIDVCVRGGRNRCATRGLPACRRHAHRRRPGARGAAARHGPRRLDAPGRLHAGRQEGRHAALDQGARSRISSAKRTPRSSTASGGRTT